ncbi:amino acid--tRNA ligase-related protein [Streptomyces sp. NPDC007095]|uniref:amino acid--tRNA ligase-related protein n=1 Tax=Streptomyces sp. NPDC007095 TaxID=3154482 RepID=UPI00340086D6
MRSDLLFSLRDTLRAEAFVEVVTPTVRKADLGSGRRVPVNLDQGRFLRVMIGPALRVNMKHHQRLLEIGPYYRLEKPDEVPAPEFTMLDSAPPTTTSISCSRWPSGWSPGTSATPRRAVAPTPAPANYSCRATATSLQPQPEVSGASVAPDRTSAFRPTTPSGVLLRDNGPCISHLPAAAQRRASQTDRKTRVRKPGGVVELDDTATTVRGERR